MSNDISEVRRTTFVIRDLLWAPFNSRFSDFVQKLSDYQRLVHEELTLIHAKASQASEEAASRERKLAAEERSRANEDRALLEQISNRGDVVEQKIEMGWSSMSLLDYHK
jgi:hypothetical protein